MNLLSMMIPTRWIVYAVLAALLAAGAAMGVSHLVGIGDARATARYEVALSKQKVEAAQAYSYALADVAAAEKKLNDFKNSQEVKDAKNARTVASLSDRLRAASGPAGRLRDPHQAAGGGSCSHDTTGEAAAAAGSRAGDAPETSGALSAELTEFLLQQARAADEVNLAYISCRADAYSVRPP